MRHYLLSVLFLFSPVAIVYAQNQTIDSLQKVLSVQKEDTNKVNTLIRLSAMFTTQANAPRALTYAKEALALASKLNFSRGEAFGYMHIGFSYGIQQNFTEQLNYFFLALKIFQEKDIKMGIAATLHDIGRAYDNQRNYSEAIKSYTNAFKIYDGLKNKKGVAECYRLIGVSNFNQENIAEALKYYYKALRLCEELNDKQNIARCLLSIGSAHQSQGDFSEALNNMLSSLAIWEEEKNPIEIARLSNTVGSVYVMLGNYQEALKRHQYALQIVQKNKNLNVLLPMTLSRLGGDYKALADKASTSGDKNAAEKMYGEALQSYTESLKRLEEVSNKVGIAEAYWHFGSLYTRLKKYDLARDYFEKSLQLSKEIKYRLTIILSYNSLAQIDSIQGNYQKAFENYKAYVLYKDSTLNDETIRKAARAKLQYEFSKKADSLELQQQLTDEKLKEQRLLVLQQQQELQIEEASLKLSNQQKELNHLAYLRTQTQLEAEQSQRQEKEKQLLIVEKEKALEQANLKLKTTELGLKEKEVMAKKLERNIFVVSALALLIVGLIVWRNNRQKQRARSLLEKQKMRTQIACDLHDDIGSTLTSISFYSEMVKMKLSQVDAPVDQLLEKIGSNARTIVSTMNDIVWVINPDNDVTENLVTRMRNYAAELCSERQIQCHFDFITDSKELNLDMHQRKNIFFIYKEALHNAVKYASCSKIDISLHQTDHRLQLVVQDNGKGFDITNAKDGNGLSNMKRRAAEIKAGFDLQSSQSQGTSIVLKFEMN